MHTHPLPRIIFIGRFQPFHKGHERVVRQLVKQYGHIIIGIGRPASDALSARYPFTFAQTRTMLRKALSDILGRITIVRIEDKHHDEKWRAHVLAQASKAGGATHFVTDNPWVRRCLAPVLKEITFPLHKRNAYEGTRIRQHIREGKGWRESLSPSVAEYIQRIGGREKLQEIASD